MTKSVATPLTERVRNGDSPAFEELIYPYEGRVYQAILRITRNAADAADIYQDTMLTAYERIDQLRGEASFPGWLFRIAVNRALMHRRSARRQPTIAEDDLPRFDWMGRAADRPKNWASSAEDAAGRAELRQLLSEALEALTDIDRSVVWLKDVEGLTHAEIAAATDSTVLAIRTRLHRSRLRLRAWLSRRLEEKR